jgi:hypothetical protein
MKEQLAEVKLRAEMFKERAVICAHRNQAVSMKMQLQSLEMQEQTMQAVQEILHRTTMLQDVGVKLTRTG